MAVLRSVRRDSTAHASLQQDRQQSRCETNSLKIKAQPAEWAVASGRNSTTPIAGKARAGRRKCFRRDWGTYALLQDSRYVVNKFFQKVVGKGYKSRSTPPFADDVKPQRAGNTFTVRPARRLLRFCNLGSFGQMGHRVMCARGPVP
jgi:hypothetical protein